jgi:hypothetical protein
MLEHDVNKLLRHAIEGVVNDPPGSPAVSQHFLDAGPIGRLIFGCLPDGRVDAEFEQLIEVRMKGRDPKGLTADQIPIEGLEMPQVEDEPVTFRYGPRVYGLGAYQRE